MIKTPFQFNIVLAGILVLNTLLMLVMFHSLWSQPWRCRSEIVSKNAATSDKQIRFICGRDSKTVAIPSGAKGEQGVPGPKLQSNAFRGKQIWFKSKQKCVSSSNSIPLSRSGKYWVQLTGKYCLLNSHETYRYYLYFTGYKYQSPRYSFGKGRKGECPYINISQTIEISSPIDLSVSYCIKGAGTPITESPEFITLGTTISWINITKESR